MMLNRVAMLGSRSVSNLTKRTLEAKCWAACSNSGAMSRQGPHLFMSGIVVNIFMSSVRN